jgi:hypothetical protein
MTTKAATANGLTRQEAGWLDTIGDTLTEMTLVRKRMKTTDQRIRRADATIRRSLDETWAILRHVQTTR